MLHYHTSYTSYHTDMHKWIGARTCKQAHTHTFILISQISLLCSDKQVAAHEHSRTRTPPVFLYMVMEKSLERSC